MPFRNIILDLKRHLNFKGGTGNRRLIIDAACACNKYDEASQISAVQKEQCEQTTMKLRRALKDLWKIEKDPPSPPPPKKKERKETNCHVKFHLYLEQIKRALLVLSISVFCINCIKSKGHLEVAWVGVLVHHLYVGLLFYWLLFHSYLPPQ